MLSAMNETSVDEKKKPFTLVGDPKSKEVKSCWGYGRVSRGIMGDQHNTTTHKNCAMTHIQVMLRFKVGVGTQVRA